MSNQDESKRLRTTALMLIFARFSPHQKCISGKLSCACRKGKCIWLLTVQKDKREAVIPTQNYVQQNYVINSSRGFVSY